MPIDADVDDNGEPADVSGLSDDYAAAWDEWSSAGEDLVWEPATDDGMAGRA